MTWDDIKARIGPKGCIAVIAVLLVVAHDLGLTFFWGTSVKSLIVDQCNYTGRWHTCTVLANGVNARTELCVVERFRRGELDGIVLVEGLWFSMPVVTHHFGC